MMLRGLFRPKVRRRENDYSIQDGSKKSAFEIQAQIFFSRITDAQGFHKALPFFFWFWGLFFRLFFFMAEINHTWLNLEDNYGFAKRFEIERFDRLG